MRVDLAVQRKGSLRGERARSRSRVPAGLVGKHRSPGIKKISGVMGGDVGRTMGKETSTEGVPGMFGRGFRRAWKLQHGALSGRFVAAHG